MDLSRSYLKENSPLNYHFVKKILKACIFPKAFLYLNFFKEMFEKLLVECVYYFAFANQIIPLLNLV